MSKESYIRGFCKAAEAHGVDPQVLAKYAAENPPQYYDTKGYAPTRVVGQPKNVIPANNDINDLIPWRDFDKYLKWMSANNEALRRSVPTVKNRQGSASVSIIPPRGTKAHEEAAKRYHDAMLSLTNMPSAVSTSAKK